MRPIGIVDGAPAYNPGNYTQLSPGNFDTGEAQMGGQIVLHNVSPYDLLVWFDDQVQAQYTLHAWQPRQWNFCGVQRRNIYFYPAFTPPADMVNNAPASYLWGESYQTGEDVPQFFPADARINAVGNTISTKGTSNVLNNDGNAPGTQVVEMTPSDQASSSVQEYNDASGFHKILSAGVLRSVWNFVRGNATTLKAVLDIGDSADLSITTYHGVFDVAVVFPPGQVGSGALASGVTIPIGQVTGTISAHDIGSVLSADDFGTSPAEEVELKTNTSSGHTYEFYVRTFDGTATHRALLVDHTGLRYSDAAGLSAGTMRGQFIIDEGTGIAAGNPALFLELAPNSGQNADMLALERLTNQAQTVTLGIDSSGAFYIFDVNAGQFLLQGARGVYTTPGAGPIPIMTTAGGGNAGFRIWEGSTDPGSAAGEGDLWSGA